MEEAVRGIPDASNLTLDFYDRTRMATWVREHPGLVPWVRERVGRAIQGWRSYGPWTYAPQGLGDEYLLDDRLRVRTRSENGGEGMKALDGLGRIRDVLRDPRNVLRLVGLSGVGKTRFVQALFDDRVGERSLDPSLACYTNIADEPEPTPATLASDLIAARERAILIVDNCAPELHQRLTELCLAADSRISLITVEYDVREDQPEGTEVFSLEPASTDLIEKLVRHRFPHISAVDARTIAGSSGGNARIAIVLAHTVGKNETIGGLSDEQLFRRIFHQAHQPSEPLLLAAQALSLVYSFEGIDVSEGGGAELFRLGALIGKDAQEMFQHAAELRRRDLVQRRGRWRAVLPAAIANRLAATALQNIPVAKIEAELVDGAPERLLKSFSHRLSYLHASEEAREIVTRWLRADGLLGDVASLNSLGLAMLDNVAPVAPEATLAALERVVLKTEEPGTLQACEKHLPLLRSLAYDAGLFDRCVALLVKIAKARDVSDNAKSAAKTLASLFMIHLSGTHATIEQRLAIVRTLLTSDDPKDRNLGTIALTAALEASRFGIAFNFEFGARSRDYGYWPRNREEVKYWFGRTLFLAESLACSKVPSASQIRAAVAGQFRGLWTQAAMYEELERVCRTFSANEFWPEGWIAARQTRYYDSKGLSPEASAQLTKVERLLRPKGLVQNVRSIVLSDGLMLVGPDPAAEDSDATKNFERVQAVARELGAAAAVDQDALTQLLPALIAGKSDQLWNFGSGLAEGSKEPRAIWDEMVSRLAETPTDARNPQLFRGFLNGLRATDPKLVGSLLDDALDSDVLAPWFPALQTAAGVDSEGVDRLLRSLDVGRAWIGAYRYLMMGGVTHQICGHDFNRLLLRIAERPGGPDIAMEILSMRLSSGEGLRHSSSPEIVDIGCELIRRLGLGNNRNPQASHSLELVGRSCLLGRKGEAAVREVCIKVREEAAKSGIIPYSQEDLLRVFFRVQPIATLRALCGNGPEELEVSSRVIDAVSQMRQKPFDAFPEHDLLSWCDEQPEGRYPFVAAGVTLFQASGTEGGLCWTTTARKLLEKAPDRVEVMGKFLAEFSPLRWTGSRASIVEKNAKLLEDLGDYDDPALAEFIARAKAKLAHSVLAERQEEMQRQWEIDERFE